MHRSYIYFAVAIIAFAISGAAIGGEKILIVQDELPQMEFLAQLLRQRGDYEVDVKTQLEMPAAVTQYNSIIVFIHGKIRLMTLAHKLPGGKIRDEKGFSFYTSPIQNGLEIINEKELGLFNRIKGLLKSGINQFYIDTENSKDLERILRIYEGIIAGRQIDTSHIKICYVLGWCQNGVL